METTECSHSNKKLGRIAVVMETRLIQSSFNKFVATIINQITPSNNRQWIPGQLKQTAAKHKRVRCGPEAEV